MSRNTRLGPMILAQILKNLERNMQLRDWNVSKFTVINYPWLVQKLCTSTLLYLLIVEIEKNIGSGPTFPKISEFAKKLLQ